MHKSIQKGKVEAPEIRAQTIRALLTVGMARTNEEHVVAEVLRKGCSYQQSSWEPRVDIEGES